MPIKAENKARYPADWPAISARRDILEYLDRCPRTSAWGEISLLRQVFERAVRRGQAESLVSRISL